MNYEIVELESGKQATIYTLESNLTGTTLYEDFINNNIQDFREELIDINATISLMANKAGVADHFD